MKKNNWHLLVILELIIVVSIFSLVILTKNSQITGFAIYQSNSDGSTINDTYLREQFPTNNFGTSETLRVGNVSGGTEYRFIIKENNLSGISSGDTIVTAKLQLYVNESYGKSNLTIKIHRVTANWTEFGATWNERKSGTSWTSSGGDYLEEITAQNITNQSGVFYNFTITSIVQGWINGSYENYGIIISAPNTASGNYTYFASTNEPNSAQRPLFFIEHTDNAAPQITNISTDSSLTSLKQVGEQVNITVEWTDLESNSAQLFVCNSTAINTSGCNDTTLCYTSMQSSSPSSCNYTIQSTDNRTTQFWLAICDEYNCSSTNSSQFYMNHNPTPSITQPNGGETINQTSQGNYEIQFNVNDTDSDLLTADLYYSETQDTTEHLLASNVNLTNNCTDADSDTATTNTCTYEWNTTELYGTYYLIIILNDTHSISNDTSDASFSIVSLIDNTPPNITAQWIDSEITSGKPIQIYANISEPNINTIWVSINTTPQTNLTMTNTTTGFPNLYNITWTAISTGNYQFKTWANDTIGNLNDSSEWQIFTISRPNASSQDESCPSTALPQHTVKISTKLNSTHILKNIYAYLNSHEDFTFLNDYPQNKSLGNFTANQTKTAEWFLSTPNTETTYSINATYTDQYGNEWNSSNMEIQVTSAVGGGYSIEVNGYPEVVTGNSYYAEGIFKSSGTYSNPDSMEIKIYDALGSLTVGPASMTQESTGIYNYTYSVSSSATEGKWETIVNATKSGTSYYSNEFWNVVGGPFDVRDINVIDTDISSLNISVVTENTGGANKDLTLTWNLSRTDNNAVLDSGSDTFMVSAGSEKTWYVQPSTSYIGSVKITFLGYYSGGEKAGAYKTFTTTSGEQPPSSSSSSSSGGGGGGTSTTTIQEKTDFTIQAPEIIYLAKNIEKDISVEIKNTGTKTLTNITLTLKGADIIYKTKPILIESIKPEQTKKFIITFSPEKKEDYIFTYNIKTDQLSKQKTGTIIITSEKEAYENEIEELKKSIQDIKSSTDDQELLNKLKNCEEILAELISDVEKEDFINAKTNLDLTKNCVKDIENQIKPKLPTFKMENYIWIIIIVILVILIAVLIVFIYLLYKRLGVISFIKQKQTSPPKISHSKDLKKQDFEQKIKSIENKLKRLE